MSPVFVPVVDFKSGWDWSVGVFPDLDVFEFVKVSPTLVPSQHPISMLPVASGLFDSLPFKVGAAGFAAIDALVAGVECFAFFSASAAHESQRS